MSSSRINFLIFALMAIAIVPATAQFGGGKKLILKRALPPAVPLEARPFNLKADTQEPAAKPLADSFQAVFKAKIQSDDRFIYADSNPELQISILITRYYIEAKNLTDGSKMCTTYQGNLQGTFSVIETATKRPVASDTLAWKLTNNGSDLILVNDDGVGMPLKGAGHQFTEAEMQDNIQKQTALDKVTGGILKRGGPCDNILTQNEARDVLADVFVTEIIHLSTPHTIAQEVKVPSDKVFRDAVEEMADKQQWAKARELLEALPVQKDKKDKVDKDLEGARLYLIALANEGMGYKKGEETVVLNQQLKRGMTNQQILPIRTNLRRVEDEAKALFEKAALGYKDAKIQKDQDEYRAGERRAEESRRLYVRIQNYRKDQPALIAASLVAPAPVEPKPAAAPAASAAKAAPANPTPVPPPPPSAVKPAQPPTGLTMVDIVGMCQKGTIAAIIADRIQSTTALAATADEADQLAECGDKQTVIYEALKKRWAIKPAPAASKGTSKGPAAAKGTKGPSAPKSSK